MNIVLVANFVILYGMYNYLITAHMKGEKLNSDINCAKEYINKINEHIKLTGHVPDYDQIDEITKPLCLQNVKKEYTKIYIGDEKDIIPPKEFSYKLKLYLPEFIPNYLYYYEYKNVYGAGYD
jgi:histidinol phosphatase-like PHP family hydrolase